MFIHPETGRLLTRARLEEANSRLRTAAALRAASLERQTEPITVRGLRRRYVAQPARLRRPQATSRSRPVSTS